GRPQRRLMRQHEGQWPNDMRRVAQQNLALNQRLADQTELVIFEIAQPAVDQLRAGRGGGAGEIVLLDQQDAEPAPRGVARNTSTVDAAADDQEIDGPGSRSVCWQALLLPQAGTRSLEWRCGAPRNHSSGE